MKMLYLFIDKPNIPQLIKKSNSWSPRTDDSWSMKAVPTMECRCFAIFQMIAVPVSPSAEYHSTFRSKHS